MESRLEPDPERIRAGLAVGGPAAANGWHNEVNASLDHPMFAYRPVRKASRIEAPVLVQLGERDAFAPRRAIERIARRARRGELRRYPIDHLGCFWPENVDEVVGDQVEFLHRHLRA